MFSRFTAEGRSAVHEAAAEAQRRRNEWIGVEHLLIGLALGGENSRAASLLRRLDVPVESVRLHVDERYAGVSSHARRGELFTPAAIRALERAVQLALRFRQAHVTTDMLLLAILWVREEQGNRDLQELGLTYREALSQRPHAAVIDETPPAVPLEPVMRATDAALKVAEAARQLATQEESRQIRTDHYLLAVLTEAEGRGARALRALGVDWSAVQEVLASIESSSTSDIERSHPPEQVVLGEGVEVPADQLDALMESLREIVPGETEIVVEASQDKVWLRSALGVPLREYVREAAKKLRDVP